MIRIPTHRAPTHPGEMLLEEFLTRYTEHWMLALGPILIFVVLFARRGLYGSFVEKEVSNG